MNQQYFKIESLPISEEAIAESKNSRDAIISYIFALREVSLRGLKVIKTKAILNEDLEKRKYYEGEINGYSERLTQANENAEQALKETVEKENVITKIESDLMQLKEDLEDKESDEVVVAHKWSVDSAWKFFKWHQKERFHLQLSTGFIEAVLWSNGHCT